MKKLSVILILVALSVACRKKEQPPVYQNMNDSSKNGKPVIVITSIYSGFTNSFDDCDDKWREGSFADTVIVTENTYNQTVQFRGTGALATLDTIFAKDLLGTYTYKKDYRTTYTYTLKNDSLFASYNSSQAWGCQTSYEFAGKRNWQ